jgi:hypothetical protein
VIEGGTALRWTEVLEPSHGNPAEVRNEPVYPVEVHRLSNDDYIKVTFLGASPRWFRLLEGTPDDLIREIPLD